MNQITITVELTARNLELIRQLCEPENVAVFKFNPPATPEPVDAPAAEAPAVKEEPAPAAKTYSKADVKAVCLSFSKAGRQEELRAAFAKFGAKKLTEIAESDYPALMEALGNA